MDPTHRRARLSRVDLAVLDSLLPAGASPVLPLGLLESGFESFFADFAADGVPQLRRAFRVSLFVAGWVAPVLVLRLPPFNRLPAGDRERALDAMERSEIALLRNLMRVLKTVAGLHYGALPVVRQAIGYHS